MKAFNKYFKNKKKNLPECTATLWLNDKDTWKAALKWVLDRVQYANSDGSIIYDIKQELGFIPLSKLQSTPPQDQEPPTTP